MNKQFIPEKEVFVKSYVTETPISQLNKSQISADAITTASALNHIKADAYMFKDSADIIFKSLDLFYKRSQITDHIALSADIGLFSIGQHKKKYSGIRYGATLFYDNFSLRLGRNDYDDFSEFVPTLTYKNSYKQHSYSLEYTKQNALFYTYSLVPYEKRIIANHFSVSDYILFENKTDLWANIEVNFFSNADREMTTQFDWVFYKDSVWRPKFTYSVALEGWYTSHSKHHYDFYSPHFADSTLLRLNPQYVFSKYAGVRGKIGIGYSIVDKTIPYKYGLWLFGNPMKHLDYEIGCLESNSARLSYGSNYYYRECKAKISYSW